MYIYIYRYVWYDANPFLFRHIYGDVDRQAPSTRLLSTALSGGLAVAVRQPDTGVSSYHDNLVS